MRRFSQLILKVLLSSLVFLIIWHLIFLYGWELEERVNHPVWLWGDSQVYTGIHLDEFSIGQSVFSRAQHGLGYQDLISFTSRLPFCNRTVVGFGPLYYRFRPDRSQGGFTINSICASIEANRSGLLGHSLVKSIYFNFKSEFSFSSLMSQDHEFYQGTSTLRQLKRQVKEIDSICSTSDFDEAYELKDKWLYRSVDALDKKADTLQILVLPVSRLLAKSAFSKVIAHHHEVLKILSEKHSLSIDTMSIRVDERLFHDATHLSASATRIMSSEISEVLKSKGNVILVVQLDSNISD